MKKTCRDCGFWRRNTPDDGHLPRADFGVCKCKKLAYTLDELSLEPDYLCYDSDYSGPYVALFVGEDFGCVHWREQTYQVLEARDK
jgi:hypothetical protein